VDIAFPVLFTEWREMFSRVVLFYWEAKQGKISAMKNINKQIINLGVVLVLAGLAYFAYQGFYNRNWSDDWCYSRDFKYHGFVKTAGFYFATGDEAIRGWSLDRYSMTIVSGIANLPGVFGTQIFTAITIVLWFAALYWTASNLAKLNKVDVPKSVLLLLSGLILYYTLYISPDRFQILYWRSGVIPYSYTLISGLILLGLIASQALKVDLSKPSLVLTAFVGVLGGGFSEVGSALLFSGATLLLVVAWFFRREKKEWALCSFPTILTAWVSLLTALALLLIAPSNDMRYTTAQDAPNDPLLVPFLSLKSAIFFIGDSLRTLPVPHLILFAAFVSLSMLTYAEMPSKPDTKSTLTFIAITLIVSFLLIVAIQAPTTYLYKAPPDPRGQSLSRFVMTAGLALVSWALGGIAARRMPAKLILVPVIFLLLGYAYTARAISITTKDLNGFITRAQIWDERDRMMREAEAQGIKRIEIVVIDTHDIHTKDIMRSQDMNDWIKTCAATYYGMDEIKAKGTK